MKTRTIKQNNFELTEIGLGCWQLGGDWGEGLSDEKAFAILEEAVASGIRFFDTADVYGGGQSERILGDFFKNKSKDIQIATKFGRGDGVFPNNYSETALRNAVEASLIRLGTDSIDLLQLHCIPPAILSQGEIFDQLRKLKQEGLIKNFGASVETVEEGLLCLEQEDLLSLQVIFNIFRQKPLEQLFPAAVEKGVGIIVRLPLASGLLTGKFTADTQFSDKDHRNFNRDGAAFNVGETFAGLPFEKGIELADKIKNNFLPKELSMSELALRWILDQEAVSTIIPGASSPAQIQSNARASALSPISPGLQENLSEFYKTEIFPYIRGGY